LSRQTIRLSSGDIAYVDQGSREDPAALFVHGVLVNADLWRNVIWDVADTRRCIAPDLPAHGASPAGDGADLSLEGLAAKLDELCDGLGLDQVDVVANDTGGAVAQVFAARFPSRIRTLTLTNCDVGENFPPEPFRPFVELARSGEFGPLVVAMAGDFTLARSEAGFAQGYLRAEELSDELLTSYLAPFVPDQGKGLERFLTSSSAEELLAVEPQLAELHAPAQVLWGDADLFFEPSWANRLEAMIPGVERVIVVEGGMLFWPDEQSEDLAPLLREFWTEHA